MTSTVEERDEHVTAEYKNAAGDVLWTEDPYPFRRMFGVGQTTYHERKPYQIISKKFDGVFGNGKITYVVKPYAR